MRTRRGAGRAHNHRLLTALCCILLYSAVCGEDMIVQIAADDAGAAASMVQTLVGDCGGSPCQCDDGTGTGNTVDCSYTFEVVEATTSFVENVADLDSFTLETPPMLQIKTNVAWRAATNDFLIEYESLPSEEYKRVLYFQAADAVVQAGDAGNACLLGDYSTAADNTACWDELQTSGNYVLAATDETLPSTDAEKEAIPTQDFISYSTADSRIKVVVDPATGADSFETISITVSLESILDSSGLMLGTHETITVDGNVITYYTLGIGMLFWHPTGSNTIIFDKFHLVEDSVNTWKVETVNQYTLARYASFQMIQTQAAQDEGYADSGDYGDKERAFILTLMVQSGYILANTNAIQLSYKDSNGNLVEIQDSDHTALQTSLASSLPDDSCFNPKQLTIGTPRSTMVDVPGSSGTQQEVITLLSAIPNGASVKYNVPGQPAFELSISMHLCQDDGSNSCVSGSTPVLSLLNFDSSVRPTPVCNAVISQSWSPIDFAQMSVYTKDAVTQMLAVRAECAQAECTAAQLYNDEGGGLTSFNQVSSLMLVAIHQVDSDAARDYFGISNNIAQLDQLYITHKLSESTVDLTAIENAPNTNADSRSTLLLDTTLTGGGAGQCHEQTIGFVYSNTMKCITTHDFDLTGPLARSNLQGSGDANYVHELKYKGSAIVTDTSLSVGFSVSNTVSFILYLPDTFTPSEGADVTITTDATVITHAAATYKRHFVSFDSLQESYTVVLAGAGAGTAGDGSDDDTTITLTHDATLELDGFVTEDTTWLNKYYNSEQDDMLAFYQDARAQLVSTDKASLYLVSPTFNWPGQNVIGLVDTSLLSMSWSVSEAVSAPSGSRRRLLQVSDSVSDSVSDLDEKQYRRAESMDELGTACSVYADTRDFPMTEWRDVLLGKLNCTEEPGICNAVQSCDDLSSPCVHAVTDAARSLRLLGNWDSEPQIYAQSISDTNVSSDNSYNSYNASVVDADQHYQETPAPFNIFDVDAAVARASASVVIDGDFACQTALRHKDASKPPAVLNVPYDNAVPPPLQLEITRPDGNSTCSLEALVQAMAPMQLLHASTHSAIFVAPHIAAYMSPIHTPTRVNTQALFAAAHRAHDNSLPSATASAHLRQQRSFFTLPSAALKWLHDRPSVLQDTDRTRVALTCGATTYHEQIDFSKIAHTRRMLVSKKVRRPEVHLHADDVSRDSARV